MISEKYSEIIADNFDIKLSDLQQPSNEFIFFYYVRYLILMQKIGNKDSRPIDNFASLKSPTLGFILKITRGNLLLVIVTSFRVDI